jgi:hypothetical protein
METLTRQDFVNLNTKRTGPCVSIYMPTHRKTGRHEEDRTRLKNLVRRAEKNLKENGPRGAEAMVEPASRLLDDLDFWQHQNHGLAVFCSTDFFRFHRLPIGFDSLAVVSDRFHTKPLLPLISEEGLFHILALSQKQVRLFAATRYTVDEIHLEDVPTSLDEALRYDVPEKQQLQIHKGGGRGRMGNVFHGQVMGTEDNKEKIERFFKQLDHGVRKKLFQDGSPLVLAGVEYLLAIYREITHYKQVLGEGLRGNPDDRSPQSLHEQAKKIVEPYFQSDRRRAVELYFNLSRTDQASHDIETITRAAYHGRVSQLLVARDVEVWGGYDADNDEICRHEKGEPGDEDLLDFAAAQTFLHGGTVFAVAHEEMPDNALIAAVFRY